jgi:hypothetical protein
VPGPEGAPDKASPYAATTPSTQRQRFTSRQISIMDLMGLVVRRVRARVGVRRDA